MISLISVQCKNAKNLMVPKLTLINIYNFESITQIVDTMDW